MVVLVLALALAAAVHEAVLEHVGEGPVAHLQLLLVLEVHEVALPDRKGPQELSTLGRSYGLASSVSERVSSEQPFSARSCICTLALCSYSSLSNDFIFRFITSLNRYF